MRTDTDGISIYSQADQEPAKVLVEYPSSQDLLATQNEYSSQLKDAKEGEAHSIMRIEMGEDTPRAIRSLTQTREEIQHCQTILDLCESRKENPVIGRVLVSSGIKTTSTTMRLDWALVRTGPEFFSRNQPPPRKSIDLDRNPGNNQYEVTEFDFADRFGDVVANEWVMKRGRTTEITCGKVNGVPVNTKWTDDEIDDTREWTVISTLKKRDGTEEDEVFARQGDSGAMVFNKEGELVGMISGFHRGGKFFGAGLITPIREIIADVKATTSGELQLP